MSTQRPTDRCDLCGGRVVITATGSPYEFAWRCTGCPHRGVISWAHENPPPTWRGEVAQPDLFSERA